MPALLLETGALTRAPPSTREDDPMCTSLAHFSLGDETRLPLLAGAILTRLPNTLCIRHVYAFCSPLFFC